MKELYDRVRGKYKITPSGCWEWTGQRRNGYGTVEIRSNRRRTFYAHRVVAMKYLGLGESDPRLVCHRCDNPLCIKPTHLFLGSSKDNMADCISKRRNYSKLSPEDVRSIRTRYQAGGLTQYELADEYHVSQGTIGFVLRGETWRHCE